MKRPLSGILQLALDLFAPPLASGPAQPQRAPQIPKNNLATGLVERPRQAPENVATDFLHQADLDDLTATRAHHRHPRANRTSLLAGARVAYEFRRARRKSIGMVIGAEGLVVSAPTWVPLAAVEQALQEKAAWIVRKLAEQQQREAKLEASRIDWRDGAGFPYLGETVIVVLDPRHGFDGAGAVLQTEDQISAGSGNLSLDGVPRQLLRVALPHQATARQIQDAVQAWLMREARRVFTERLDHFAPLLNVQWRKLSLSSAGTRWGSAGADGSIRLNWRLIHFSRAAIDYVVAHELSHLREMNHGPAFWDTVASVVPDYASLRGQLRDEAIPRWD